jgi:peroxiredoxin Q/BCP
MKEIEALDAFVIGVSTDGGERLQLFSAKYQLSFALLSDQAGTVAARYGSLINLGLWRFARRNTFLIDPQGRIAKIYQSVNPSKNSQQVIEDLQTLRSKN